MTFLLAPKRKRLLFLCYHLIWASKVQIVKNTWMHFYLPQKEKELFLKAICPQYPVACPIRATIISWSLEMLARIWLLLAPGNRASAYVAPWPFDLLLSVQELNSLQYEVDNLKQELAKYDDQLAASDQAIEAIQAQLDEMEQQAKGSKVSSVTPPSIHTFLFTFLFTTVEPRYKEVGI